MTKGKYYTPEFKEQAVKMVVESTPSRTIGSVARELDANEATLGCWVATYRKKMAGQLFQQLGRLRFHIKVELSEGHHEPPGGFLNSRGIAGPVLSAEQVPVQRLTVLARTASAADHSPVSEKPAGQSWAPAGGCSRVAECCGAASSAG
jgi:hypothetical protein